MFKHSTKKHWMASLAQDATMCDALYHATRWPRSVLRDGALHPPKAGLPLIRFTASAIRAAELAITPERGDEGHGAILVFDKNRLSERYKLVMHRSGKGRATSEWYVFDRVIDLGGLMISMIGDPVNSSSRVHAISAANVLDTSELRYL